MKCVITGGRGQLAQELVRALTARGHEAYALNREQLDITSKTAIAQHLDIYQPEVVFNCASQNDVDLAEKQYQAAAEVNTWGVQNLAEYCHEYGIRLFQFSTDHVFGYNYDLNWNTPNHPDESPAPLNAYGLTKLGGEYRAQACHHDSVIIRTCSLYGNHGLSRPSFPQQILGLVARASGPIYVVDDEVCTPTYTADLAETVVAMLHSQVPRGVYHVTNSGECSWYQFAKEMLWNAGVDAHIVGISSAQYREKHPWTAPRPKYSVLHNRPYMVRRYKLPELRTWQAALADYVKERRQLLDLKNEAPVLVHAGPDVAKALCDRCALFDMRPPDSAAQAEQDAHQPVLVPPPKPVHNAKAVAVAKDVLQHLSEYKVKHAGYLSGAISVSTYAPEGNMQQHLPVIMKNCAVCALGACLLSAARLYDALPIRNFACPTDKQGFAFFINATRSQVERALSDIFTLNEMSKIESAFEQCPCGVYRNNTDAEKRDSFGATFFGQQYHEPGKRLRAIMTNVVDNGGVFVVEPRDEVVVNGFTYTVASAPSTVS